MTALTLPRSPALDDAPRTELRLGWTLILAFFGLFLGWAAFVRLDAAVTAPGTITVAGNRKAVQSQTGGTVAAIHVREGQHVRAGDELVDLASAEMIETDRALAQQLVDLLAVRARLIAETSHAAMVMPADYATLPASLRAAEAAAFRRQQAELANRGAALADQRAVLHSQGAQLAQQIVGTGRRIDSNDTQARLIGDELAGMRALAAKGFASINRLRALERSQADIAGQSGSLTATIAATREQIGETRMHALALDAQALQTANEELRTTETSLADLRPRYQAAHERLDHARVRATASGQVVGLTVFTVGGVVQPGALMMEIVPDAAPLVIDAQVAPNDADDLHVGQSVQVQIGALHDRGLPTLHGTLTRVSADAFHDERTGQRYYTASVTVPVADVKRMDAARGGAAALKPGLTASIMIPLRARTMLQYLVEPFDQALWRSGREH